LSYKRFLIRLLDRPGGRLLLSSIATRLARHASHSEVDVKYVNGLWTHRIGTDYFPDDRRFLYSPGQFNTWKGDPAHHTKEFWLRHYQPETGDVVIDAGAGRGEDILTFSRSVGPTGRVIALEPHPVSFNILNRLCALNRLSNVTCLQVALMNQPGTVRISNSASWWGENAIQLAEGSSGIQVPATTLAEVCQKQGLLDIALVKMNIEGAERYALLGTAEVIPRIRQICVACHDFRAENGEGEHFRTRVFVEQFLSAHGFTLASRANDPRDYVRDHIFGLRAV